MRPLRTLPLLILLAACSTPGQPGASGAAQVSSRQVASTSIPAAWPYATTAQPVVAATGMVVSDAPLATLVGIEALQAGGNAVDAAIATAFALAVVLPSAGNLGGGGFALLQIDNATYALDFRETAPAAATRDMFLDEHGKPTERSLTGHLAAGVPGSVAGLWELHRRFGSRPWSTLIDPAISLAENGFAIDEHFASLIAANAARLGCFEGSAALYLSDGKPISAGTHWKNPDLARTLRAIAGRGRDGFYRGETAAHIVAEMRAGGGIITRSDLAGYEAKWREPVIFPYRGYRVASMPPPSSGGVTLALIAGQLERFDLAVHGWRSTVSLHLLAEAMKRAYAVRNAVLGDPDFVDMRIAEILSAKFINGLADDISLTRAAAALAVGPAAGARDEGRHTTHFSVADDDGNAVALTTTINSWHGSAVTVRGAGFLLNNEMDDFASRPGYPNQFGLVQGEANTIEPGKRMLSSMSPTIVLDDAGAPILVTGASGGSFIISTVFQLISNRIDFDLGVVASMSAPRMHHQHLPDVLRLERAGFAETQTRSLQSLGHEVQSFHVWDDDEGAVAATIERRGRQWHGFADPRIGGLAGGF